jgi:hypothetical protein
MDNLFDDGRSIIVLLLLRYVTKPKQFQFTLNHFEKYFAPLPGITSMIYLSKINTNIQHEIIFCLY